MSATDARDECCFEISRLQLPGLGIGGGPPPSELLEILVAAEHPGCAITRFDRGDLELAWTEYDYPSDDPHRGGESRPARNRCLLGSDGLAYVWVTFCYWIDDAAWAVPAWERIVDTLEVRGAVLTPNLAR